VVKPMLYVQAEGIKSRYKRRLHLLNHRGQRTWHVYKGRIAEDGRTDCFPPEKPGNRPPGRTKARLSEVTIISKLRDTNQYDGVRVSATRDNQSQREGQR